MRSSTLRSSPTGRARTAKSNAPPNGGARMGLWRQLPQLKTPRDRSATLATALQHEQAAQRARSSATDQPRSEPVWAGRLVSRLKNRRSSHLVDKPSIDAAIESVRGCNDPLEVAIPLVPLLLPFPRFFVRRHGQHPEVLPVPCISFELDREIGESKIQHFACHCFAGAAPTTAWSIRP